MMSQGSMKTRCLVCNNLEINADGDRRQTLQGGEGYKRIAQYLDLQQSAFGGCKICSVIREGIEAFPGVLGQIGMETEVWFRVGPPLQPLRVGILENKYAGARWLEFFTLPGEPTLWTAFGAASLVPERLDIEIAASRISQWLDDCKRNHKCGDYLRSSTVLPTRVLDLNPENPNCQDDIKLFETRGKEGTYMTLSHCWGPAQFITTTDATIGQRIAGIPLTGLPKTFKDAVSLTRRLGIQYLWIDSLCIKQGEDKKDWEREASKMGSVYSQSYLNIAATSSGQGSGGCFKERLVHIAQDRFPSAVRSHKIVREYLGIDAIYVRPLLDYAHSALDRRGTSTVSALSPLLSRAWVYQERVLAPRTVHFHATEMLWECVSSSRCECGGLDRHQFDTFRPDLFGRGVDTNQQWLSVIQQYSGLNLSYPSDKFPALSGIAEKFQAELQCDYLAGLWRNDLLRGLQWIVAYENKAFRRKQPQAPTWSWASLDKLSSPTAEQPKHHEGIRVTYAFTESIEQDNRLGLVSARVTTLGKNPYGEVEEGGEIVLRGAFLTPCEAKIETELTYMDEVESTLLIHFEGHPKEIRVVPDVAFTSLPLGISQAPYAATALRWLVLGKSGDKLFGLLLKLVEGQKDKYERVGLPFIYRLSPELQKKAELAEFKII